MDRQGYIGVFDSGVGGISVLKSLVDELPGEDFVFFGDSANAPYGEKPVERVLELSRAIVDDLISHGAKAIVIACNTATSAAAAALRAEYPDLPIVGVEPALKPATLAPRHGRILVMATPVTLRLDKFHKLAEKWGSDSEVIGVPCVGLASRIEKGDLDAPDLLDLIEGLVGQYRGTVDSVVLGCTHYPFVKRQIRAVLGDVPLFDGAEGTARRTRSLLEQGGLLRDGFPADADADASGDAGTVGADGRKGTVTFRSSRETPEELALYQRLFEREL